MQMMKDIRQLVFQTIFSLAFLVMSLSFYSGHSTYGSLHENPLGFCTQHHITTLEGISAGTFLLKANLPICITGHYTLFLTLKAKDQIPLINNLLQQRLLVCEKRSIREDMDFSTGFYHHFYQRIQEVPLIG